MTTLQD